MHGKVAETPDEVIDKSACAAPSGHPPAMPGFVTLRYVELFGEIHRGITVLKMRGSMHDKESREYVIDGQGMHILKPFRNVTGILSGHPRHVAADEQERMGTMFGDSEM